MWNNMGYSNYNSGCCNNKGKEYVCHCEEKQNNCCNTCGCQNYGYSNCNY